MGHLIRIERDKKKNVLEEVYGGMCVCVSVLFYVICLALVRRLVVFLFFLLLFFILYIYYFPKLFFLLSSLLPLYLLLLRRKRDTLWRSTYPERTLIMRNYLRKINGEVGWPDVII